MVGLTWSLRQQTIKILYSQFQGRVRGEVIPNIEFVTSPTQFLKATEQFDWGVPVVAGGNNEACGEPVSFGLEILRVGALEQPDSGPAERCGAEAVNIQGFDPESNCRVGDNPIRRMSTDDMGHLMGKDESNFVLVPLAQFPKGAGYKDETSRKGESVGFSAFD